MKAINRNKVITEVTAKIAGIDSNIAKAVCPIFGSKEKALRYAKIHASEFTDVCLDFSNDYEYDDYTNDLYASSVKTYDESVAGKKVIEVCGMDKDYVIVPITLDNRYVFEVIKTRDNCVYTNYNDIKNMSFASLGYSASENISAELCYYHDFKVNYDGDNYYVSRLGYVYTEEEYNNIKDIVTTSINKLYNGIDDDNDSDALKTYYACRLDDIIDDIRYQEQLPETISDYEQTVIAHAVHSGVDVSDVKSLLTSGWVLDKVEQGYNIANNTQLHTVQSQEVVDYYKE